MNINKQHYLNLNADCNVIVSGEVDHKPISAKDVEALNKALGGTLQAGSLFTGENVEVKPTKRFNMATSETQIGTIARSPQNIECAKGRISYAEYNSINKQLRVYYTELKAETEPATEEVNADQKF